jgi:hypothetical protein
MRNSSAIEADGNASGAKRDNTGSGPYDPETMIKTARPAALALVVLPPLVTVVVLFAHNGVPRASRALPAGSSVDRVTEHPVAATPPRQARAPASTRAEAFPSAAEFANAFVGTANQYAKVHGDPARINQPDCVQAAPGRYMCSYAVVKPGTPNECHLMQAQWTPQAASTISITLAGRTTRCRSIREALNSLH